jgi:glycosyltransferase involved in cell wall biosynthesis
LVVDTVLSILANTHPNFELVVVDQSKDDETLEALRPFGADPRLRYARIATVGKGNALSAGIAETKGSVIAITDDDCTVPPKWLEKFASIFTAHPKVAVAFCSAPSRQARPDRRLHPGLCPHLRKDADYHA